ncbi:hypothetical protein INR49_021246 [Caranx melampygus]|nr:hypothetical protein INR49_021246 [Caranx melampygus]
MGHPPPDFRIMMPYNLGPHGHGPFPPAHRQHAGRAGLTGLPLPCRCRPLPLPRCRRRRVTVPTGSPARGPASGSEATGPWAGSGTGPCPTVGTEPGTEGTELPPAEKLLGRAQARKAAHSVPKPDTSVDESFEDLLSKYKQIQLELECIRKEETMALEPKALPAREDAPDDDASITETRPVPEPGQSPAGAEETAELEKAERKVFQAFNIKPLRQKLPTPANLDELQRKWAEQEQEAEPTEKRTEETGEAEQRAEPEENTCSCCSEHSVRDDKEKLKVTCSCRRESSASSEDSLVSPDKPEVKVEEEELSELQLRLLALQSASKKWQQKEQQVMKKSKDRITRAAQEKSSAPAPGPAPSAAPPGRQRIETEPDPSLWTGSETEPRPGSALQTGTVRESGRSRVQSRSQISAGEGPDARETSRHQEDDQSRGSRRRNGGRTRRSAANGDEIRRIRDLSNQDEQYNRFMKLVGGKMRTRSKSRDREHRKSTGKPGLDASGNLYQYDNYDEVAMDTDSETGSPVSSPTHNPFTSDDPGVSLRISPSPSSPPC